MSFAALRRALSPFWQFEDASRGDLYARSAAHQRNLGLRDALPRYLWRWLLIGGCAATVLRACDALAADIGTRLDIFAVMAAGSGLVCAGAVCALVVIGYAYLYLGRAAETRGRP